MIGQRNMLETICIAYTTRNDNDKKWGYDSCEQIVPLTLSIKLDSASVSMKQKRTQTLRTSKEPGEQQFYRKNTLINNISNCMLGKQETTKCYPVKPLLITQFGCILLFDPTEQSTN